MRHDWGFVAVMSLVAIVAGSSVGIMGESIVSLALVGAVVSVLAGIVVPIRILLFAVIAASFVTVIQVDIGGSGLRLDMALLPALLVATVAQGSLHRFLGTLGHLPILLLWLWIAQQAIVSTLMSVDPVASLRVTGWFAINLTIVMLVVAEFKDQREQVQTFLIKGAALTGVSGVLAWLYGTATGLNFWGAISTAGFGVRAQGIAYEPNILAGTCAIWLLVIITGSHRLRRREIWIIAILSLGVIFANTRAAYVALAVGLAVAFLYRPEKTAPRAVAAAVGGALGVLGLAVLAPAQLTGMAGKLSAINFTDQASTYRFDSWNLAIDGLARDQNWMFGLGTASFQQRYRDPTFLDERVGYYLGNFPLQVAYDSGLVGFILVGLAALSLLRRGRTGIRVAIVAAFAVISIATSPFFFSNWWLFIALALLASRPEIDSGGQGDLGEFADAGQQQDVDIPVQVRPRPVG